MKTGPRKGENSKAPVSIVAVESPSPSIILPFPAASVVRTISASVGV